MVMTMSEPGRRVIMVAVPVEERIAELRETQSAEAAAVDGAIDRIGIVPGRRIDLPTAPAGTPYYALRTSDPDAPVIIYRQMRKDEDGDYLVVSLMTPSQYRQQQEAEESGILDDPSIRQEVVVVANTAATSAVRAFPGTVTRTQPGAVPTATVTKRQS
jgi:hypothetical protein